MESIITAEKVDLVLTGQKVLADINFEVEKKETLVLMGKNGSGKTVLLKTLVGLLAPSAGEVRIFDKKTAELDRHDLNELQKKVGFVFQKSGLFDSLPVWENVVFAYRRYGKKSAEELIEHASDCLNRSGLKDVEQKLVSELSGGMQKRAAIARSIAMNPELLIMDDPAAGLDPVMTDAIADLIIELRERLHNTAIVATHDLKFAQKLADRIGLIVGGRLHGILPTDEFMNTDEEYFKQFREGALEGPIPVVE